LPGATLTRYWFKTTKGLGFGITAFSEEDAKVQLTDIATTIGKDYEVVEIIADVDVRTLDQTHVIPNMGPPSLRGVWYPLLNLPPYSQH
jgi:hypothetical protein